MATGINPRKVLPKLKPYAIVGHAASTACLTIAQLSFYYKVDLNYKVPVIGDITS